MYWIALALGLPALGQPADGPEQAARQLFQSIVDHDRTTLASLCPDEDCVRELAREPIVEILRIGPAFTRDGYAGTYVPYEITLRRGAWTVHKAHNLAVRNDNPEHRWVFDGGY